MPRALRRREGAAGDGDHALRPAEFSGAGRADQSPRHGDERDAHRGSVGLRGHYAVRVTRPAFPGRTVQSCARADAAGYSQIRRWLHGIRGPLRSRGSRPEELSRIAPSGRSTRHSAVARLAAIPCFQRAFNRRADKFDAGWRFLKMLGSVAHALTIRETAKSHEFSEANAAGERVCWEPD